MKWILIFIIGVVLFVAYSCMLWRDGYNDGMLEERRKRIRSFTFYNKHIQATRDELDLLWADLNDIKSKLAAEKKPLTFNYEHSDEPIGKVVDVEERDGGLLFHIKAETDEYMATDFGEEDTSVIAETVKPKWDIEEIPLTQDLTPIQKEAFDSLCS